MGGGEGGSHHYLEGKPKLVGVNAPRAIGVHGLEELSDGLVPATYATVNENPEEEEEEEEEEREFNKNASDTTRIFILLCI